MADRVSLRWQNRQRFFKQLLSVVPEANRELAAANQVSAEAMATTARNLAPVASGALRDSIRTRPSDRSTTGGWIVEAGGPATTRPVRKGQKKTYDYALGVEFGTSDTAAAPFFWPSYRSQKRPAKARATRALTKAIKAKGFKTNG